jgi:hypothetical protein
VLADRIAELAAAEARRLVRTAADMVVGDDPHEGAVLEAIERAAQHTGARIGLAAVSGIVDWAGQHTPSRADCPRPDHIDVGRAARLVERRPRMVKTLLGSIEIVRGYYHCRGCGHGFAPLDARLGVTGTSLSPGLARSCALAGAEMPFDISRRFIATVTGLDLASTSTLARTTRSTGDQARALIAAEHAVARPGPIPAAAGKHDTRPDLCYIVLDGTGAPMLPSECADRAGKDGGKAGTREVKLGCFFTQTDRDPATGDPVQDPGSAGYISTFDPAAAFGNQVKAEYWRRGFDQIRQPIVLGDGAKWIWGIAGHHFPHATQIVDYFHAREHLADLTKILTPVLTDPAGVEATLVDHLDLGNTDQIAATVDACDLPTTRPDLTHAAATEVGYFTANHHRMQYADFKANGYYIGSGHVESACNTIVKQRAKRAGMHWTVHGLDPILAIRTLIQSDRADLLWPTPQT